MDRTSTLRTVCLWLGAFLLAGLAFLAAQQHRTIARLRAERQVQQADLTALERLRAESSPPRVLPDQQAEIDKLREDNKDLLRLRNEIRQLREQVGEIELLRAANARFLQLAQNNGGLPSNQMASVNAVRKQGALLGIQIAPPSGAPGAPAVVTQRYKGALVAGFMPDAPAAQSELKPGDIIIRLDGHPIESAVELQVEMLTKKPGDTVLLDVMRGETMLRIPVQTRAWPE